MFNRILGLIFSTVTASFLLGATSTYSQPAAADETVALIKEEVSLSGGIVEGNLQLTDPLNFSINGGFSGNGFLLLPGVPNLEIHRQATVGILEEGEGADQPSNYTLRLQARAELPGIRTRSEPSEFPEISFPPAPTGHLDIRLTQGEVFEGDLAEIRDLTLANDAGPFYLPPGHYGDLNIQRGARLLIGVEQQRTAAHYTFTNIDLSKDAAVELLGPVRIETGDFSRSLSGTLGNPNRPEWLSLGINSGDWTLDRGSSFYGTVVVPNGEVGLLSNSSFCGEVFGRSLSLGSNALLRYCGPSNQQPLAEDLIVTTIRGQAVAFQLEGSDPDGDEITYVLLNDPENGELTGEAPDLVYTPSGDFAGEEVLRYTVFDGELMSDEATVTSWLL